MATQHPDNALAPYWDKSGSPFVSAYQEITEAVACFEDLDVGEYMWDWEGKHADAAVIDRLFTDHHDYFAGHQLGCDKFLTFRIPNIWEEKGYNLLQAMTVILSGQDFARDLKFHDKPLFEIILPMTESADQILHMQKLFGRLARFKAKEFMPNQPANDEHLEMIPLVESVESQLSVDDLLAEYVKLHKQHFGRQPGYIRPFLACSDSALSSGFLAGLLGNKIALARLYEFSERTGIKVFPIMGCGSLLFRGGLSPESIKIERFLTEFPGVRTVTVQSSFRYDHSKAKVRSAIARLEQDLPHTKPKIIDSKKQEQLIAIAKESAKFYKQTIADIAGGMQPIFKAVPRRRDRRQHIGLGAYSRSMGEQTLPRAITFTAGFYSIGVPPEFIGFGRTLRGLSEAELELLKAEYPNIAADFEAAGRYLNRDNLAKFAGGNPAWEDIQTDIYETEKILDVHLGPQSEDELKHQELSNQLSSMEDISKGSELITEMSVLRRSLG